MTESATSPDRRAQLTAVVGTLLQLAAFTVLVILGSVQTSDAVLAAAIWTLGGVVIWPVLAIIFGQRHRMLEERRQAAELKESRESEGVAGIFDAEDESYLVERRRLRWVLRWLLPGAVVVLALYHLIGSFVGWPWAWGISLRSGDWHLTQNRGVTMTFVGGVGFIAFLFSRYAAGMARIRGWQLLRSGASYMAGNALACLIVLIAIGVQGTDFPIAEAVASYAIRIAFFVLGVEFVVNFMLDFYRPRVADEVTRPAFDSRTLGLITEPGGVARSLADAINYQFGFEVSSTWFYALLKRALLPMLVFGVLMLFALSSVLIVDADERAVVERFGRRLQTNGETLSPGVHFKAPWPIDIAYTVRADQVRAFTVGETTKEDKNPYETVNGKRRLKPILWGEKHEFNAELSLVLASKDPTINTHRADQRSADGSGEDQTIPAALLMISVDIQYRIKDLHGYLYTYLDPEKVVEQIAYQVLTNFAAGVTEDQFLGPGRTRVNQILSESLQKRLDEQGLGIDILFVALQDAHPQDEVAKVYQGVVQAEIAKDASIENAVKEADRILTEVAGNRTRALELDEAILASNALAQDPNADPAKRTEAEDRVRDLLLGNLDNTTPTGGEAAVSIASVQQRVLAEITQAKRDRALFDAELVGYESAPRLYRMRKYLDMLRRATDSIRKYVIVVDPEKKVIIEYEKEEKGTIELAELEG